MLLPSSESPSTVDQSLLVLPLSSSGVFVFLDVAATAFESLDFFGSGGSDSESYSELDDSVSYGGRNSFRSGLRKSFCSMIKCGRSTCGNASPKVAASYTGSSSRDPKKYKYLPSGSHAGE